MENQTLEQACEAIGFDVTKLPDVSGMPVAIGKRMLAGLKLDIFYQAAIKSLNFVPDYSNYNQGKYIAWLDWVPSLGAFVSPGTLYSNTNASLGARFCFPTRATAKTFAELHIDLVNDLHSL